MTEKKTPNPKRPTKEFLEKLPPLTEEGKAEFKATADKIAAAYLKGLNEQDPTNPE